MLSRLSSRSSYCETGHLDVDLAEAHQQKPYNVRFRDWHRHTSAHRDFWSTLTSHVYDAMQRLLGERPGYRVRAAQIQTAIGWGSLRQIQMAIARLVRWGFLVRNNSNKHSPLGSRYQIVGLHSAWDPALDAFAYRGERLVRRLRRVQQSCISLLRNLDPGKVFRKAGGTDVASDIVTRIRRAWNRALEAERYAFALSELEVRDAMQRIKDYAWQHGKLELNDRHAERYLLSHVADKSAWAGAENPFRVVLGTRRLDEFVDLLKRRRDKNRSKRERQLARKSAGARTPKSKTTTDTDDIISVEQIERTLSLLHRTGSSAGNAALSETQAAD